MWLPEIRELKRRLVGSAVGGAVYGALALGLGSGDALAGGDGTFRSTPEKFVMIFARIGLCPNLTCPAPVVTSTQTAPYDIASVGPGGAVGSFTAGATPPPGTYTHLFITLGRDIVYRGRVPVTAGNNAFDCVSNGSPQDPQRGVIDGDMVAPGSGTTRDITAKFASMFEVGREFVDGNTRWKITSETEIEVVTGLPQPIVIAAGQPMPTLRISIDAAGALWAGINSSSTGSYTCYMYGEAPAITLRTE